MKFEVATTNDLPTIFYLYEAAVAYQRKHGYNLWPVFKERLVREEIGEQRLWKITEDGTVGCVFSIAFNDPVIWGERDADRAIYLHRIATHPDFKGRHFVGQITAWAREQSAHYNYRYIRMDTWADNIQLCDYYSKSGYKTLGTKLLPENSSLPAHYSNLEVRLFEIDLLN